MYRLGIRKAPLRTLSLITRRTKYSTIFDTEDASKKWSAVEDILPPIQIPSPDLNQPFPTPSGNINQFHKTFLTRSHRMATAPARKKSAFGICSQTK